MNVVANTQRVEGKARSRGVADAVDAQITQSTNAALAAFSADQVATMPSTSLLTMQRLLRHGSELGIWCTPSDWLTPGAQESLERIDMRSRIQHFLRSDVRERLESPLLEKAVVQLTRYLVLLRVGPSGLGRASFRSLSPTSVLNLAFNYVPNIFAVALTRRLDLNEAQGQKTDDSLLSLVRASDLGRLSASAAKYVRRECERMRVLSDLGLWRDAPSLEVPSLAEAMSGPAQSLAIPPSRDPHRPLPDDYVSMLGTRTLWVVRELGPNLLALARGFEELWERTDSRALQPVTVRDRRREAVKDVLARHAWVSSSGQPLGDPPFPLALPAPLGFSGTADAEEDASDGELDEVRWPPQNYRDFTHLLGTLQAAHLVVALLSIGPRRSEVLSLSCDCVVSASDGRTYADGRTFKLVERHEGEERDWLLPELAVDAIEQQARLVRMCEQIGFLTPKRTAQRNPVSQHLWRRISSSQAQSDPTKPLRDINKVLVRYARTLGLDTYPGGQRLRSHRFRKTLARLVALALTQAPRLLMDVFGHKSLEMTLYYILTDKDLRAEIEAVSRELRVMRAKEVVEAMVAADVAATSDNGVEYGGYGGIAATSIHTAVVNKQHEIHRTGATWGAQNAMELAELLTLQGTAWQQVRTGVMCTKLPGEAGPCNRSKGRPEPGKCSSSCEHRLEDAFLREDVEAALTAAVSGYERAVAEDDEMTAAHWAGQVRANLPRFRSIQRKWSSNPTIRLLVPVEVQP